MNHLKYLISVNVKISKKQCLITPVKLKLGVRIKIWEPHVTPNPALLNL